MSVGAAPDAPVVSVRTRGAPMDSFFSGDLTAPRGRLIAWVDSLLVDHAFLRLFHANFGTVIPGRVYRSNHPTPMRIRRLAKRLGLTTIVNLRGVTGTGSYHLSRDAALRAGLAYHDLSMESRGAPHVDRILRLWDIFRTSPGPILLHCKSGADRAGLAAGLCVLFDGGTAGQALRQMSLRYGHIRQAKTGILDAFFLRYQRDAEGRKSFLQWLTEDYDRDSLRRDFHANGLASFVDDWILAHE
jgi:protein tyrosine/serine phosphatase